MLGKTFPVGGWPRKAENKTKAQHSWGFGFAGLGNIFEFFPILGNIGQFQMILDNFGLYCSISKFS